MKRSTKTLLTIACAALLLGGSTACSMSAYDIAVKNGYMGTESEWLNTLRGEDGKDGKDFTAEDLYKRAQADGYKGTFLEFCKEILSINVQEENNVDVIANNITSVVSIYCGFAKNTTAGTGLGGLLGGGPQTSYYTSAGAGVIIDLDKETGDALVVTNYHVIFDSASNAKDGISEQIYLYTYGALNGFNPENGDEVGDGMKATFIGGAMYYDIALLRISGNEFLKNSIATEATFAESSITIGEKVFAIGNPDGAGIAVTEGIISVESEYITMELVDGSTKTVDYRVMRTDAAINGGNSGGALFNAEGDLIGITNAKNASSEIDNMGYALHGSQVKSLCENILRNEKLFGDGKIRVATLGVTVTVIDSEAYFDENGRLKIREKFQVYEVSPGTAAAVGGVKAMDTIQAVKINGGEWTVFNRQYQLIDHLLTVAKGDTITIKVIDVEGKEQIREISFNKDAYFMVRE